MYSGAQSVIAGRISLGELSESVLYVMLVASSVAVLAEVWGEVVRAAGATERLVELLATRSDIADPAQPRMLPRSGGGLKVEFDHVTFRYPSRPTHAVLDDLSLAIEPGETVALVGPSGAGKTTIFQLLLRFYEVTEGAIRFDGVALTEVRLDDLRSRIALVPQDAVIFSADAMENIRYGRPSATRRRGHRRRTVCLCRRLHSRAARGVSQFSRRARRAVVRRPAAAPIDCTRDA